MSAIGPRNEAERLERLTSLLGEIFAGTCWLAAMGVDAEAIEPLD